MIPERSAAVTDREEAAQKHFFKWVPYEALHNANGFAVVIILFKWWVPYMYDAPYSAQVVHWSDEPWTPSRHS